MKNVKTYICMFLMIMGTCASAWGAGEYTVNITNNLTGCSAKAGNPTSFSSTSTSTVELHYTIASGKDGDNASISVKNGSAEKYGEWMCSWSQYDGSDYVLYLYSPTSWVGNNALTITINCPAVCVTPGTPTNLQATNVSSTSAQLSWNACSNTTKYEVNVTDGDSYDETKTVTTISTTWTGLAAETYYMWAVRAIGSSDACVGKQETGEFTTTAAAAVYDITYHVPSCATAPANVVDHASGAYTLPNLTSNPGLAIDGYTFVGWTSNSSYADGTSAPTPLYTTEVSLGSDMHLYAVYSKSQSTAACAITWTLMSADPLEAGNYVISNGQYATGIGTNKVMDNEMTSRGSRIAAKDITMSGSMITSEVTSVAWQFAKQGDYWTIYNPYAKKYVAATANDKEATLVSSATDDAALWTITKSSNTYNIISKSRASEGAKYLKYNSSSDAWGCYSTNSAVFLYKTDVNPFEGSTTYTINPQCTTYSVTYNVNGGTGSVPTDANKYAQGATAIVLGNVNGMTKDGFAFAGWATSSSATVAEYHSGSELTIETSDVTLYAVWNQVVTITYKDQGNVDCTAENIDDLPTEHVTGSGNTALVAGTKTNYYFRGWYYTSACTGDAVTEVPSARDANLTLYAKWEAMYTDYRWKCESYTVTYHDAEGERSEEVDKDGQPIGVTARACSDENRVFVGWSAEPVALTQTAPGYVTPTDVTISAEKHFYAVYASKNGGKVTNVISTEEGFESQTASATYNSSEPNVYTNTLTNLSVTNGCVTTTGTPIGNNHIALQYNGSSETSKGRMITGAIDDLKEIEFKAKRVGSNSTLTVYSSIDGSVWTNVLFTGVLSTNYGSAAKRDIPHGHKYVMFEITSADATGSGYRIYLDDIVFYTNERSYYLTDYATSCEKAASMTLTYDAQGGTAQTDVTEAGWVTLPDGDACQRGCYTLTGWLCSGDELTYEPGAKYLFNHDVTMTAQWSVNTSAAVTVTYHTGLEGAETVTVENVHCGDILTEGQVPTPAACGQNEFAGWAIGEFANAASKDGIAQYAVGTDVVMGNMELHAIWKQGKSVFTKYTETDVVDGTYILVEPNSSKALSATLVPTPVTIDGSTITTDERFIQWTVTKVGEKFSIHGLDGYLTITADKTNALGISNTAVETWNMKESSTNGVYNIGITFDASDRRVCYNSTKDKWLSYKNRTSGNLYKLSGDGPATFTMDGVCPHIYHATGVSEMTSGTGVSVLAQENGLIIVENTSVVPVAHKVSGDDAFVVTVNETPLGANGDGSLNYSYSVKFTPTAGNQTYTATYKFIGTDETEDEKHIASEAITFTGYSLPDEFAIVVNRGGQYYALPGGIAAAGTPNAVAVTVEGGEVIDLDASNAYHIGTGAVSGETARATLRLMNGTTALWATKADNANINDYSGDLTSTTAEASTTLTQWTLERAYDDDDNFLGYHLSSDANVAKALFYQSTNNHWGYYNNSYYSGGAYNGEIFFLPIAAQFGDVMDIVEWNASNVVLNMNGYGATNGKWGVKNASDEMLLAGDRATDRTLEVSTAALVADQYLNIKVYGNANNAPAEPVVESNRNYKIPHIMEGAQSISSAASFSATSILYVKSGVTTVNVNLTVAKVVVCPGAELVVASGKTLTTTDLVLRGKIWTYEQPKLTINGSLSVTGQTYYTRIVADKSAYYPFGLPKSSKVEDVRLSNGQTVTYGPTANWNLKSYNADAQLNNEEKAWSDVTLTDGKATIAAKTYYIMGSGSAYYREYYFPISLSEGVDNTVAIAANQGGAETLDKNKGWNGFASPYTNVYSNAPEGDPSEFVKVTEKVENNEQWWQHVPDQLYPFFPYFYQTKAAGTLSFDTGLNFEASTPASVAARAAKAEEKEVSTQWVQVMLKNENGQEDETNLYVHPTKFTVGYETSYDVTKMSVAGDRPLVWTKMACGDLAFNALPDSIAETRIAVGVNAGTAKTLSFSLGRADYLSRVEEVNLIDEVMGTTTNLLLSDYEWKPEDGTEGRFFLNIVLQKASSTTTGIDGGIEELGNAPRKVIYDSKMFIIVDGKIYDGTGKLVNK